MKRFVCGDVVAGCDAHFESTTEDQILAEVAANARHAHGLSEVPPELVEQVRQHITLVAA